MKRKLIKKQKTKKPISQIKLKITQFKVQYMKRKKKKTRISKPYLNLVKN